jgi:hypothetical protein
MRTTTLKLLEDYFSTTDNVFIQQRLRILEIEIDMEITKAKIETFNELKNIVA